LGLLIWPDGPFKLRNMIISLEAGKVVKEKGKRKLRKVVTGDPDKRLRDHMREVPQVHIFSI
jgi:hypothetical protein